MVEEEKAGGEGGGRFEVKKMQGKPGGLQAKALGDPEVRPPLEPLDGKELEEEEKEEDLRVVQSGKIPIHPAVVKPLLRFEGEALKEFTGYPGWLYSEEDLANIAELVQQTGLEATPIMQLMLALAGAHAERTMGYFAWKRSGKAAKVEKEGEASE